MTSEGSYAENKQRVVDEAFRQQFLLHDADETDLRWRRGYQIPSAHTEVLIGNEIFCC